MQNILQFKHPAAFFLLFLFLLLYILRKTGLFEKPAFPLILSDWKGRPFEWKNLPLSLSSIVSKVLCAIGFISAIVALAEPVVSRQEKVYTSRGTDIMFVLDTSPSMSASDIAGMSRLDAAKQTIKTLVQDIPGATFGLVSMASEAVVIIPPTLDHISFTDALESIKAGELGDGTAIGTGISTAIYHLLPSKAPKKCIVLLTDGENNAGSISPDTAAKLAFSNNITIYAAGIGTKGSVPIEYVDPRTGKVWSGFLDSQFDESVLRGIASSGGGLYFPVETLASLSASLNAVASRESVIQGYQYKTNDISYYGRILAISISCFALSWILSRLCIKELI